MGGDGAYSWISNTLTIIKFVISKSAIIIILFNSIHYALVEIWNINIIPVQNGHALKFHSVHMSDQKNTKKGTH